MASQAIVTLLVFMLAVACGQADAPTPLPNTPTPFPTATPTPTPQPAVIDTGVTPEYCNPAELDKLQEYSKSPASRYLVRHPSISTPDVPTIVFLPSGKGQRRNAGRMWDRYLSGADDVHSYRVVLPFEEDFEFIDDVRRTLAIMDEVFACYGGDRDRVHLAGVSTGGLAAFRLALGSPELFQTVLGAPGAFPTADLKDLVRWAPQLSGIRVFNGVGEQDDSWIPEVLDVHEALVKAGVESVHVVFPGQRHMVDEDFDETIFFDFWGDR